MKIKRLHAEGEDIFYENTIIKIDTILSTKKEQNERKLENK